MTPQCFRQLLTTGAPALTNPCIALLGRQDEPTDAVEEYCHYLAAALQTHDIQLEIHRVAWKKDGWPHALQALRLRAPIGATLGF